MLSTVLSHHVYGVEEAQETLKISACLPAWKLCILNFEFLILHLEFQDLNF